MAEIATNFPPQTYSSSFFLNSLTDEEKNASGSESTKRSDSPLLDCFISTMRNFIVLIIFSMVWYHHRTEAVECSIPHEDKVRIFSTFREYQSNKLPFNFLEARWQGSSVEFSTTNISQLEKNSFITYESESIISLKLSGKGIKKIDDGAFISLLCLHNLYLDHNNVSTITGETFQDLGRLSSLDLSYNEIKVIKEFTFANLTWLKVLDLSYNKIEYLEVLSFRNNPLLESLYLGHNIIGTLPGDIFKPTPDLLALDLSWNHFSTIQPQEWAPLPKLVNLSIAGNNLINFDPSSNFSFFALKTLNVSSNSLNKLNVIAFRRYFPVLELIDLNNNPWECNYLDMIVRELNESGVKTPSSNFSTVASNGIACRDITTTTTTPRNFVDDKELERYVEKKIRDNNVTLRDSISSIRTMVIFVFTFLCVFILIEVVYKSNFCGTVGRLLRRNQDTHLDDSHNAENLGLLRR